MKHGTSRLLTTCKIALDLFIDNVPNLAIWAPMVYHLETTLTPEKVLDMSDESLAAIAQDSSSISERRLNLRKKLEILLQGRDECEQQISKSGITCKCLIRAQDSILTVLRSDQRPESNRQRIVATAQRQIRRAGYRSRRTATQHANTAAI